MQGFPQTTTPMSPVGATVSPLPYPAAPIRPFGIAPTGAGFPMAASPPGAAGPGMAPFGWPTAAPQGFMPPAPALSGGFGPSGFTGGIPGVAMTPVNGVTAPAATGGPHPLPYPPQFPLPQGFPNPFTVQHIHWQGPQASQLPQRGQAPGMTLTTGPQGFMPGLGYFGVPGSQAAPIPPAAPAGTGPAPAAQAGAPNPFWLNLAWQLVQTPAVRQALGARTEPLVTGDERLRTLGLALTCLAGPDLQEAFRGLSAGSLDQARFIDTFAEKLKAALGAAGML